MLAPGFMNSVYWYQSNKLCLITIISSYQFDHHLRGIIYLISFIFHLFEFSNKPQFSFRSSKNGSLTNPLLSHDLHLTSILKITLNFYLLNERWNCCLSEIIQLQRFIVQVIIHRIKKTGGFKVAYKPCKYSMSQWFLENRSLIPA